MKSNLPVPVIAVVVVLILGVVGFLGFRVLAGPAAAPVTSSFDLKKHEKEAAQASGGDFDRLSPSDQKLFNDQSMGHGKNLLKNIFNQLQKGS